MPPDLQNPIVIGAGLGGLTLAVALKKAGIQPRVYERASAGLDRGSGITLWPNALRALDILDLGQAVRNVSAPLDGIGMFHWKGAELFRLDRHALQGRFGSSGLVLHRSELIALLLKHLGEQHVRFGVACIGFEQDTSGVIAFFDDGSEAQGSMLVGADGLRSIVRSGLFGTRALRYSGYTVWRGIAHLQLPRRLGSMSLGRGSQFGIFPMTGNRIYWFASANASEGEADGPAGRKPEILTRFKMWHQPVLEVIDSTDQACILRNDIYDMDPLPCWSLGRTTLLGDAAHPSTPDLGQGACQAIEDAVVLTKSLATMPDVSSGLKAYEAGRIGRTRSITLRSRRIGRFGTWANPIACWLRDQSIRLTPASLHLRQLQWVFDFRV